MPWFLPSFLTPTFLVLGLLAISLPILFHFFRRTPKGNVRFSSLMFLQPSPPRLTRRSRVDNWLLLILRAMVLLFIALAFGRVFFRQTDFLSLSDLPSRRVAILVDTSASMLRGDLWEQAKDEFAKVLDGLGPNDEVGLFTFDDSLSTLSGFSSSGSAGVASNLDLLRGALNSVSPRWRATRLGQVLIETVDELMKDQESDSRDQISDSQIVLISDLQEGSDIQALRSFEWPENIPIDIKTVGLPTSDNATLSLVDPSQGIATDAKIRVKVTNVEESQLTEFDLHWLSEKGDNDSLAATVVVPPGQSRVINLKFPDFKFEGLELRGDSDDFDNRYYVATPDRIPRKILFVGDNDDVRNQLRFYLKKACASLIGKRFEFSDQNELDNLDLPTGASGETTESAFVFVTGSLDQSEAEKVRSFASRGGHVCVVVTDVQMQPTVSSLVGTEVVLSEAKGLDYALLSEIDFSHKIFAPFADPKYSNFSNIQFWKHRRIEADGLRALASFDNGALAFGYQAVGQGQLYLIASGWHPADSQMALSTKFVGVMMSMMLTNLTRENRNVEIGVPFKLSEFVTGDRCSLVKPGGETVELDELSRSLVRPEADVPGIYQISSSTQTKRLAFNLPASESRTDRLSVELLEQEEIKLGTMSSATDKVEKERQRKDKELESRQKLWRWMLILALVTLFAETMISSFFTKRQSQVDVSAQD